MMHCGGKQLIPYRFVNEQSLITDDLRIMPAFRLFVCTGCRHLEFFADDDAYDNILSEIETERIREGKEKEPGLMKEADIRC